MKGQDRELKEVLTLWTRVLKMEKKNKSFDFCSVLSDGCVFGGVAAQLSGARASFHPEENLVLLL